MRRRLHDYVFLPNRVRKNTDRCVLAIAVAWSGYRILSGAPELDAAKQGLALVFVGMTITTILNVVVPRRSKPSG
jgi:hypothetical protein